MNYRVLNITRHISQIDDISNTSFENLNINSISNKTFKNFLGFLDILYEEFGTSNIHKTQINDLMCISVIKLYKENEKILKENISINCIIE